MLSHVEMAPAAGGFKLFGKVITQCAESAAAAAAAAQASPVFVAREKEEPEERPASRPHGERDTRATIKREAAYHDEKQQQQGGETKGGGGQPPRRTQQQEAAEARAAAAAPLPCPRCRSRDTKFCYFNNYNVNQPRHFCRACHRYWTAGGVLRNVPVGSGRRKNRPAPHTAATSSADHRSEGSVSPGLKIGFPPDHGWSHAAPSPPAPYTGHGVMELYRWLVRKERPPFGSDRAL